MQPWPDARRLAGSPAALRAGLIRANACRFAERYDGVTPEDLVGEGAFGRVHCCTDRLARTRRAVKVIDLPNLVERRDALNREVASLVSLDHPHIVRLIEYFLEDDQVLLVMELLNGPTLREKMDQDGVFSEEFAARCARHMLKALFCCHCNGIAHNDVTPENFKFSTRGDHWNLKMVDFGLSVVSSEDQRSKSRTYVEKRDVWGAGVILYRLLFGIPLFGEGSSNEDSLICATDPSYIPRRITELQVSDEARGLLSRMLEPATDTRASARKTLLHPFITRFYPAEESDAPMSERLRTLMSRWLAALRRFHVSPRLKKLALVIAAHLLTNNNDTIASINFLFRFFVRDGAMADGKTVENLLRRHHVAPPEDFAEMLSSADLARVGGLTYVQFVASSIVTEPDIFCQDSMLRAVFRFLDAQETGTIRDDTLTKLFVDLPDSLVWEGAVAEACGVPQATFQNFKDSMLPEGWRPEPTADAPADWAEAPDGNRTDSDEPESPKYGQPKQDQFKPCRRHSQRNLILSVPSETLALCQYPGFHTSVLRPYYACQRVSNVVMGIVGGGSSYARTCAGYGLAKILDVGGDENGAFFMMPNPKYHWDPLELVKKPPLKWRFVAWWIAPMFLQELRSWFDALDQGSSEGESEGLDATPPLASPTAKRRGPTVGDPGDFSFSDIAKPPGYLHTYRDLHGPKSAAMLQALVSSVRGFLESLVGETLSSVPVSAGFHYPVRPQYSTLHLQLRVNAGDVCGGDDRRGFDLMKLINLLSQDPEVFQRDEEVLRYRATDNLRSTILSACKHGQALVQEVGPDSLVVRPPSTAAGLEGILEPGLPKGLVRATSHCIQS